MTSLSQAAEAIAAAVAADVALTLTGHSAAVQAMALEVYDGLMEDLLVGRGLPREEAAALAAMTVRTVRARLAAMAAGGARLGRA